MSSGPQIPPTPLGHRHMTTGLHRSLLCADPCSLRDMGIKAVDRWASGIFRPPNPPPPSRRPIYEHWLYTAVSGLREYRLQTGSGVDTGMDLNQGSRLINTAVVLCCDAVSLPSDRHLNGFITPFDVSCCAWPVGVYQVYRGVPLKGSPTLCSGSPTTSVHPRSSLHGNPPLRLKDAIA